MRVYCGLLAWVVSGFGAQWLAAADDEFTPPKHIRLLPVGDPPPFRQEIRGGVRYELEPPAGSIPPRQVFVPSARGGKQVSPVRLKLGSTSRPFRASPGTLAIRARETAEDQKAPAWHRLQVPDHPVSLAILWRDPQARTWDKARSLVLADDLDRFPPGRIRFVNVSPFKVAVRFGGRDFFFAPGKVLLQGKTRSAIDQQPLLVAFAGKDGEWRPLFNSAVSQAATERTNVVVYRADGFRPRRPAKILILRENPSPHPPPRQSP